MEISVRSHSTALTTGFHMIYNTTRKNIGASGGAPWGPQDGLIGFSFLRILNPLSIPRLAVKSVFVDIFIK